MRISFISFIVFLLVSISSFAQLDKANRYYDDKEYTMAIKAYEGYLRKNETNIEALEKIANAYRITKNYQQAELYYSKLFQQSGVPPINHYYYGLILKNNNKIEEAKEQFKTYTKAVPGDKKGTLSLKSCDDAKKLLKKAKMFEVSPVSDVNTPSSEFSPVIFKNQLVFVSDRKNFSTGKQDFLHVFYSDIKKEGTASKKVQPYPWPVNTEFQDGPVCFNPEQNMMVITHVDLLNKGDKNFINRSKLYFSLLKENKWTKVKPFQYNSDEYSIAHPCISADGKKLFFSSDKPGGEGGMDIYVCEKDGENWGTPVNLGKTVNTIGEEVFPFINKEGTLFFSSDGHSGLGGLDVFLSLFNSGKYSSVKNIGTTLNSSTDDFGIVFNDDNHTGYFSSDRPGGAGSDDIYSFTSVDNSIIVDGKIVLGINVNGPLKNSEISLLSEEGEIISTSHTDKSGAFKFEGLEAGKKYMVKLNDEIDTKQKFYLLDGKSDFIRETGIDGKGGKMVFRNLPADPNAMPEVVLGGSTFAGNLLVGETSTKPLVNTRVNLLNDKGEIVQTVVTNAFGAFVFTNLPPDQNFLVQVDETDAQLTLKTKIILTNKNGKEMQVTSAGEGGAFKFQFLASDKNTLKLMEVEDNELRMDFKGKFMGDNKKPMANVVVNLLNEKGEIIQTTVTDKFGAFKFANLPADQKVLFAMDENDPQLKLTKKLMLMDDKGNVVKEEEKNEAGAFKFSVLPSEKKKLSIVYVDDPWLKVLQLKTSAVKENLTIIEKIYFDYGKYTVLPEAAKILDKVIGIMEKDPVLVIEISSHTDSRSSAESNMELSQKRANAAVEYIIKNGIAKDRITGKGYGESKLINNCTDGVACSEEEHAKNRRAEFKVSRKAK